MIWFGFLLILRAEHGLILRAEHDGRPRILSGAGLLCGLCLRKGVKSDGMGSRLW